MDYFWDMVRYNVMVSFLCMVGRVKETCGALQEMRKKGFIPDVFSYNSVMEACCREDIAPCQKVVGRNVYEWVSWEFEDIQHSYWQTI
ncbi:Tetratricopeptide repeat (TPR)-like superfamily protein [Thalictrum thalictroides]|uniref:Tetratricopeptide repeat (TPR)-like superfamily protein n=1 Tax=Thalictrum thalictroides TaxID=46969 RepID=A0A7J6V1E5_THATH|nr:Tetratricopeptide repeat (TPR)-like superfamily protein [Thalictrum thalictroides]